MNCRQSHDQGLPYDPALHGDSCLANVMGPVYREMKGRLIQGGDPRVWMLPCPICAKEDPATHLVLDLNRNEYACARCCLALPVDEILEAAGEKTKLEVI